MSSAWGQIILMAGLAGMVHLPVRAETTGTQPSLIDVSRHTTSSWQNKRQLTRPKERSRAELTTGTAAVVVNKLPIARVLYQISDQSGVPIILRGNLSDVEVSVISAKPQPVAQLLRSIEATSPEILVKKTGTGFDVWDKDSYYEEARESRAYTLQSVPPIVIERAISGVLTKSLGTITRNDEHNTLLVYDVPEKQAEVEKIIRQLDNELPVQVFTLSHADADQIAKQLENFLMVTPLQISADVRTRKVILRAPESQIKLASKLIQAYDTPAASSEKLR